MGKRHNIEDKINNYNNPICGTSAECNSCVQVFALRAMAILCHTSSAPEVNIDGWDSG